ncbi:MAG: aminotransferase class I/II-fold pyridoxal phosphate-dependent enzyme [Fidelibacterota bacterium]|nr:MAG: aminotransferase class I/II-fold pyridoxal phosphate-dependent enzyme [Candidatus Neomarinimicrobiota bacterium]
MIDLRSDTVTTPNAAMRQAIAEAEVGDDVFGEDPTVLELQAEVARLLGKEAGLFVPSGTMSNQIAIKSHTQPGDEVICEIGAHILNYEAGGPAFHSQVQLNPIHGRLGIFTAEQVEELIRPQNVHMPTTRLISIENTHNKAGGTIFPLGEIHRIAETAATYKLRMHMDGARLMNAVVATGIPAAEWAAPFDSVSLCLSKGLGAPVGSVLCGSADFVQQAHRYRKLFGGGMRQVGILAAGGLYAVRNQVADLAQDHQRAKRLAEALSELPSVRLNPDEVHTNIVILGVSEESGTGVAIEERLGKEGVQCLALSKQQIRLVTHRDLTDGDIDNAIRAFRKVLS